MTENKVLIEFKGHLTFVKIGDLINELRDCFNGIHENVNTYKRVLTLMVETLENICKYGEIQKDIAKMDMEQPTVFILEKTESNYFITAGNLINAVDQSHIESIINNVNNMDKEDLKKLYREIIANGQFNNEGGAGLGFIELAKTSGQKIGYTFTPANDTMKYFTIYIELRN